MRSQLMGETFVARTLVNATPLIDEILEWKVEQSVYHLAAESVATVDWDQVDECDAHVSESSDRDEGAGTWGA